MVKRNQSEITSFIHLFIYSVSIFFKNYEYFYCLQLNAYYADNNFQDNH